MAKISIYCNYGVLAEEKKNVYTCGAEHETATCSDEMTVEIPDGWELFEAANGKQMVRSPWGWDYEINDILAGNQKPQFRVMNKNGELKIFDLKEVS